MKKLIFAIALSLSLVFIGDMIGSAGTMSANAQVTVKKRRSGVYTRSKHGVKYVGHKTARGSRYVYHKSKRGVKWTTRKTVKGTRWTAHKTKRGTKRTFHVVKKAVQ